VGAFQFFITKEMTNNIVLQTNRKARRRIRAWNESNPEKLHVDWKPVDGEEVRAFFGLCILVQEQSRASVHLVVRKGGKTGVHCHHVIKSVYGYDQVHQI